MTVLQSANKPHILFITRKYPPSIGGMQKMSFLLAREFAYLTQLYLVSFGRSQIWLPLGLMILFSRSLTRLASGQVDVIYLGDSLLAPMGLFLGRLFHRPVALTAHGLDVTWPLAWYQAVMRFCLPRLDLVICVSQRTAKECLDRGVASKKITIINNGIDSEQLQLSCGHNMVREKLATSLGIDIGQRPLVLSVGRLVPRKGYRWFIEEVAPRLLEANRDTLYLVAGEGPLATELTEVIKSHGLQDSVILLGRVTDETLHLLYHAADVFVMPNIIVPGDMEGFGIVLLEAGACSLPIIATGVEGICDALMDGHGILLEPKDADGFAAAIIRLLKDEDYRSSEGARMQEYVNNNFSISTVAERYVRMFQEVDVLYRRQA